LAESLTLGHYPLIINGWLVESNLGRIAAEGEIDCEIVILKAGACASAQARWSVVTAGGAAVLPASPLDSSCGISRRAITVPCDSTGLCVRISEGGTVTGIPIDLSAVWLPPCAIRITEINPRASGAGEWFEITNTSPMAINLRDWGFGNSEDTARVTLLDARIDPGRYLIAAKSREAFSSAYPSPRQVIQPVIWHTLDNYRDTLCLWDRHGILRERVAYESGWFTQWENQTIERVSLSSDGASRGSWSLAAKPSPGQPSATALWRSARQPSIDCGPTPFTPNGDQRDDFLLISVVVPAGSSLDLSIYGFDGSKYLSFSGPPRERYQWDGCLQNGAPAPRGPFFVVAEIHAGSSKKIIRKKGVLWRP
jgi:hypothetical protein